MNEEKVEKTEDKEKANRKDELLKKLKQFTKTRWFPLIVAIAVIVLAVGVVLVMLLFGWRITYAPELGNNWDAISGVAAWVGVGASFMAVWYAVRVADKQNKISLFEKRYELYNMAICCKVFAVLLDQHKDIRKAFLGAFFQIPADVPEKEDSFIREQGALMSLKILQFGFLFKEQKILSYMIEVMRIIKEIVTGHLNGEGHLENKIQNFIELINDSQFDEVLSAMQKELMLK